MNIAVNGRSISLQLSFTVFFEDRWKISQKYHNCFILRNQYTLLLNVSQNQVTTEISSQNDDVDEFEKMFYNEKL